MLPLFMPRARDSDGAIRVNLRNGPIPASLSAGSGKQGWAMSDTDQIPYITFASVVPSTAQRFQGIAFTPDGAMYCTEDAVTSASKPQQGIAIRNDGAVHVAQFSPTSIRPAGVPISVAGQLLLAIRTEAQTLTALMGTQPTFERKLLINQTIRDFMTAGIWDKYDLCYFHAMALANQTLLNWKNPGTNTLTANNSPTFTANKGYTGNASNMTLTGAYTNVLYTQNNAHISAFGLTDSATNVSDLIVTNVTPATRGSVQTRNTTTARGAAGAALATQAATGSTVPILVAANRDNDAANQTIWINGALDTTAAQASLGTVCTAVTFLGGLATFSDRQIAFGGVGASFTTAQNASENSIVRNFMTYVGAY